MSHPSAHSVGRNSNKYVVCILAALIQLGFLSAWAIQHKDRFGIGILPNEIAGKENLGLKPIIQYDQEGGHSGIQIIFLCETNFAKNEWLRLSSRIGAKLKAWDINNIEIPLKDASAIAVLTLPVQTSVSNVIKDVPRGIRGMQWWPRNATYAVAGKIMPAYYFKLNRAFGIEITNDLKLEIRPLIYKVDPDMIHVKLIEFSPFYVKVKPNGVLENIK